MSAHEETHLARRFAFQSQVVSGRQDDIGCAFYLTQLGEMSGKANLGSGVMEIAAHDASRTFRAVYTVSIGD